MTSLRYLIALHVGLYHLVRPFERWGALSAFFAAGYSGVSFFFLLSGFILTYTHAAEYERGQGSARRFWLARFARIYPMYLVSILLACYVDRGLFAYSIERKAAVAGLFMVQSWSSRLVQNFNVPAWSLSCEAFFYLLFPFLLPWLRAKTRTRSTVLIAASVFLAMLGPAWALLHYRPPAMHELPVTQHGYGEVLRIRRLPLLALPEFMAGIALGWLYVRHGITSRVAAALAYGGGLLLLAALCCSAWLPYVFLHNGLLIPLQCAVILGLCGRHWLTRIMSHPWLMLLGEASYSLYLIHLLVFEWLLSRFHLHTNVANAVWELALITAVSLLLYRFIERPCRRTLLQVFN